MVAAELRDGKAVEYLRLSGLLGSRSLDENVERYTDSESLTYDIPNGSLRAP